MMHIIKKFRFLLIVLLFTACTKVEIKQQPTIENKEKIKTPSLTDDIYHLEQNTSENSRKKIEKIKNIKNKIINQNDKIKILKLKTNILPLESNISSINAQINLLKKLKNKYYNQLLKEIAIIKNNPKTDSYKKTKEWVEKYEPYLIAN